MTVPTTWPGLGFDPAPGEPTGVHGLVQQLSTTAGRLRETHDTLTDVTRKQGEWTGEASEAFVTALDVLPRYLLDAHESLRRAGEVLGRWHGALDGLQTRARDLESAAVTARTDLGRAEQTERSARSHPDLGLIGQQFTAEELPAAQARIDAAQAELDRAVRTTAGLRDSLDDLMRRAGVLNTEHADAARAAADGVRRADDGLAPPEPAWFEQAVGWVGENLGLIGDVAGFVSGIAGAAALIPVLTPFAAPIALVSGGVAALAHGADLIVNEKWKDPGAVVGFVGDVAGIVPGGRLIVGGAVDMARGSFETTPGLLAAVRSGWEGARMRIPDAVADAGGAGGLAALVADRVAPLTARLPGRSEAFDPSVVATAVQGSMDVLPQVPQAVEWVSGTDQTVAKNVATGASTAANATDGWFDHVDRLAARAAAAAADAADAAAAAAS